MNRRHVDIKAGRRCRSRRSRRRASFLRQARAAIPGPYIAAAYALKLGESRTIELLYFAAALSAAGDWW